MITPDQLSDTFNLATESLTHIPEIKDGIGSGVEAAVSTAAFLTAWVTGNRVYDSRAKDAYAMDHPDLSQVEASIDKMNSIRREGDSDELVSDPKGNRRERLFPVAAVLAGSAIALASVELHPTYTSQSKDNSPHVMVVEDDTQSMWYTKDLVGADGKITLTRDQIANLGLAKAKKTYSGSLGAIEAAGDDANKQVIPSSTNWGSELGQLNKAQVDQDVDYQPLVPAIEMGADALPLAPGQAGNEGKHVGTEVIITDGTTDDTPQQMQAEASKLQAEGIKVDFIVPGTSDATYKPIKHGASYDSSVDTATVTPFAHFAKITDTSNQTSTEAAVASAINAAGYSKQENPWIIGYLVGGVLFAGGVTKGIKQRFTVTV